MKAIIIKLHLKDPKWDIEISGFLDFIPREIGTTIQRITKHHTVIFIFKRLQCTYLYYYFYDRFFFVLLVKRFV